MQWKNIYKIHKQKECNYTMVKDFCKRLGLDKCAYFYKPYSLKKLLEGKSSYNSGTKYDVSEKSEVWKDHFELYKTRGTSRVILTAQPYADPVDTLFGLNELVHDLNIRAVVFDRDHSWYYQNETCLVLLMSNSTYKYLKSDLSKMGKYWTVSFDESESMFVS